jgi:hypothetical protein
MARLKLEVKERIKKELEQGVITCLSCGVTREVIYFGRQKYVGKNGEVTFSYKYTKCKICTSPKGEEMKPHSVRNKIKTSNKKFNSLSISISPECKEFIKRVIFMKGYIDVIEAYKLVHYHIETFGYIERLILNIEDELHIMFVELLNVFKERENI